ncbi:MAG: BrnT family toxin [Gemmatimonadota bacterium]
MRSGKQGSSRTSFRDVSMTTCFSKSWRSSFGDPLNLLMLDPDHSESEQRYLLLGMSTQRRLLVVAFAERPHRTRLISARPATRRERKKYEEEERQS